MASEGSLNPNLITVIPAILGRSFGLNHLEYFRLVNRRATVSRMRTQTKRRLGQMWGYLILVIVAYGWLGTKMGPGVIAMLSGLVVLYMLFQAPMWCCATTRGGEPCRNNSYGILLGCHVREHKWQKMKMAVRASKWGQLTKRALSSISGVAAAISAVAGVASAVVALATLVLS